MSEFDCVVMRAANEETFFFEIVQRTRTRTIYITQYIFVRAFLYIKIKKKHMIYMNELKTVLSHAPSTTDMTTLDVYRIQLLDDTLLHSLQYQLDPSPSEPCSSSMLSKPNDLICAKLGQL